VERFCRAISETAAGRPLRHNRHERHDRTGRASDDPASPTKNPGPAEAEPGRSLLPQERNALGRGVTRSDGKSSPRRTQAPQGNLRAERTVAVSDAEWAQNLRLLLVFLVFGSFGGIEMAMAVGFAFYLGFFRLNGEPRTERGRHLVH
jgi:hypothetical protein